MKSKTIILSNKNKSGRGILTFTLENDLLNCKLRLYECEKLNRYAKLGVYHGGEVYSANFIERGGVYYSSLVGNFDMDADFYSAIIKTDSDNEVVLSGGTYAGFYFDDNSVFSNENTVNDGFSNKEKNSDTSKLNYETEEEDFKNCNDKTSECNKCANCKYKEFFYAEQNKQKEAYKTDNKLKNNTFRATTKQSDDDFNLEEVCKLEQADTPEKDIDTPKTKLTGMLQKIIPQFDYIFKNYSPNDELNKLVENGKFVKMEGGDYSLGAIYESDQIKYICYAVKCNYNTPAPSEIGEHYQWLPLNSTDPLSEGYYIVFQDAEDLKIIEF